MVTKYPSSDYFEQALDEQYRIANLYLAGEPQRIWKIPVGPSMERTIEMYQRIIKNAPYGTYAPQCQFKIGLAREKQRKYTDAVDAYQTVLDNYPTSSVAANAQYQIGYAWMKSSTSRRLRHGRGARRRSMPFRITSCAIPTATRPRRRRKTSSSSARSRRRARSTSPKFYETQHESRAAFIYYNEVVQRRPEFRPGADGEEAHPGIAPAGRGPARRASGRMASGNPAVPPQKVASGPRPGPRAAPARPTRRCPPTRARARIPLRRMPAAPAPSRGSERAGDQLLARRNAAATDATPMPARLRPTRRRAAPVAAPPDTTPLPQ